MSSFVNLDTLSVTTNNMEERLIGIVKWFNNKAGYGFITVKDGQHSGCDIFVHHTSILLANTTYRYLEQGEYVEFTLSETNTDKHPFSATNVTGIKNGSLMCEPKNNVTNSRFSHLQGNTPFHFENAHSGAFLSVKSNGSMRIFDAQRCKNGYQETFCEDTKYSNWMNEHRPPEISVFPDNEFRGWKKNVPMAPKSCDTNTVYK